MAVGAEDEVVVTKVVAAFAGIALDVVLTGLVDAVDQGLGAFFRQILLFHDTRNTVRHGGSDKHVQFVGMVPEYEETGTAGHHAGTHRGKTFQDFHFGLEDIARRDIDLEFL